jgi:hypothetical protein
MKELELRDVEILGGFWLRERLATNLEKALLHNGTNSRQPVASRTFVWLPACQMGSGKECSLQIQMPISGWMLPPALWHITHPPKFKTSE